MALTWHIDMLGCFEYGVAVYFLYVIYVVLALQAAMKRLLSEGHELGSHAAEHLRLSELPPNETAQQITWAIGNISAVTGSTTVPLFRAPYGDGFMGVASPPPTTVQQLWSTVRQQHVHIAW